VLTAALGALPDGEGPVRLGVGEASSDGPLGQTTAVVLGRVAFELDGVATSARPGETWRLALTPGRGWHDLEALALGEDGALREVPVRVGAGEARLEVEVPVDAPPGTSISVGVDGTGPHGPGKLAQLTLWVGDAPPATAAVQVAAAEPADLSLDGAERLALAYLAADRARAGKPALVPDDALAAIARRHSEDMAARGYFGHASPTTGLAGDRLRAAGYLALAHGENLAKNDHLGEAEVSLWESLGHRANIVGDAFTHVGVGIARVPGDDGGWLVTQLFARPAPPVSAATVDTLLAQINAAPRRAWGAAAGAPRRPGRAGRGGGGAAGARAAAPGARRRVAPADAAAARAGLELGRDRRRRHRIYAARLGAGQGGAFDRPGGGAGSGQRRGQRRGDRRGVSATRPS
jgi:uncharacterized protein YkwD